MDMPFEGIEAVNVYNNLVKMINHRGLALSSKLLTQDEVVSTLNNSEYIIIKATSNNAAIANLTIIQIANNSKYATKLAEFRKLFKDTKEGEIMIVSDSALTVHIANYIKQTFKTDHPKISLSAYDYEKFVMDMRTHVSTGVHSICTQAEIDALDKQYLFKTNFSNISSTETQSVWLGAKPGQLIKIVGVSETAGAFETYRYVI